MALREAIPLDASALTHLYAQSFDIAWKEEDFTAFIAAPEYKLLVESEEGHLHGFVLYRILQEEGEIVTCVVDASKRGRGFGKNLLTAALQQLKENAVQRVFLEVAVDNPAAQMLYRNSGFMPVSTRKAYYARKGAPAVDAEVMALTFDGI